MSYKQIPETTFGSSAAASYLVSQLNQNANTTLLRNTGKQITATCKQVRELSYAYQTGTISAKTFANTLRMMRYEITNSESHLLIDDLRKNVQIGYIKRGLDAAVSGRKSETYMKRVNVSASKSIENMKQFLMECECV